MTTSVLTMRTSLMRPFIGGYYACTLTIIRPVEHVWGIVSPRVATRESPATGLPEFRKALIDEWYNIPQDHVDNLILNMPRLFMSRRKQRSAFNQVSEFDRGSILAYRNCGLSFRKTGSRFGWNQTTVMRICDRLMQEGTMDRHG
ncbi:transposable element Tcb1 transposase [Trichonephila clavipes]|nr:transposable element Tcb1 transposase [Trichonephila clavipes]